MHERHRSLSKSIEWARMSDFYQRLTKPSTELDSLCPRREAKRQAKVDINSKENNITYSTIRMKRMETAS